MDHAPVVTLHRVDVRYGDADVLRGITLAIREHESWGLVGPNGSGKSTLLRLLRGEVQPTPETRDGRRYHLDGRSTPSPIGAAGQVALVSPELQEAYLRRDWAMRAEDAVRTGFTGEVFLQETPAAEQEERVAEACELLEIGRLRRRSVLELSTGELRRVLIARALVSRPRLLLLDEPCDGLDAAARAGFLSLLARLARRTAPLVVATHRYDELVPGIASVARLERGRIAAQGSRREMLEQLGVPARNAAPHGTATSTPDPASTSRARPLLQVERADVRVDGHPVLHGIDWTVRRGEHWAVVGPNGAGKSTLLRLAVGDEQAMPGGGVSRLGLGPGAGVWEVKARVGVVSPELQARFRADIPAEEAVLSGLTSSIGVDFAPTPRQRRKAAVKMARLGVRHLAGRGVHTLSYGEMRRVLVARALLRNPKLLVLDEPMNGLDPAAREALSRSLAWMARRGVTLVMATHHREELPPVVTHELELRAGRVAYAGPRR